MKEIAWNGIGRSVFDLIGQDWMLVTAAKKDGSVNTMTASWGGLGILWGKPVAFVFIRPQRYTKEFVDEADTLSLSFFGPEKRDMLSYMGKVSGRQENKIEKQGLHVQFTKEGTPYFAESRLTIVGKKAYVQPIDPQGFTDPQTIAQWYPNRDFHTMYVVELQHIYAQE